MIIETSTLFLMVLCVMFSTEANASGAKDPNAVSKEKQKTINGIVQSVNPAANTFVLASKGKEHVFQVAPKALVVVNSKLARLGDIRKNASAKVIYTVDRQTRLETASRIFATQASRGAEHGKQESKPAR